MSSSDCCPSAARGPQHGPSTSAIEVSGLRKANWSFEVLHEIDFRHEEGEVFALLGPNGSGKTTTVETLGGRSAVDRALAESLFPGGLLASSS